MTRECSSDHDKIKSYIKKYKISRNLDEPEYVASLKIMHKCYFSSITWNSELLHNKDQLLELESNCNEDIILRLSEVVSDLGSSLFNWMNGNYKTSKIMLRVAIENFIRSISALESKNQLTEINVYKLFEKANNQNIFTSNSVVKKSYNCLHEDYKTLCEDTHTATVENMEQLTSLANLPTFEMLKSSNVSKMFVRISRNITLIFCIVFNSFYHKMHHRNKENILNCLKKDMKPFILSPQS